MQARGSRSRHWAWPPPTPLAARLLVDERDQALAGVLAARASAPW
jgi:hypothetical protein